MPTPLKTATAPKPPTYIPHPIPVLTSLRYLRATAAGQQDALRLASLVSHTLSALPEAITAEGQCQRVPFRS
ncbi:hypothetical protein ACFFQF_15910 [Haladaptatus pallidirubidus]|uniref:hypothetical protein n=1 Tax=Haladaptatus pallidirubidus TaxID=1008152 RepID=UPI001D12F372|nr:hypothetical protein [Haladaptatus pallidirubidus]